MVNEYRTGRSDLIKRIEKNLREEAKAMDKRPQDKRRKFLKEGLYLGLGLGALVIEESTLGLGKKLLDSIGNWSEKRFNEKLDNLDKYFKGKYSLNVEESGTNYQIETRKLLRDLYKKYPETRAKYSKEDLDMYIEERINKGKKVLVGAYKIPKLK